MLRVFPAAVILTIAVLQILPAQADAAHCTRYETYQKSWLGNDRLRYHYRCLQDWPEEEGWNELRFSLRFPDEVDIASYDGPFHTFARIDGSRLVIETGNPAGFLDEISFTIDTEPTPRGLEGSQKVTAMCFGEQCYVHSCNDVRRIQPPPRNDDTVSVGATTVTFDPGTFLPYDTIDLFQYIVSPPPDQDAHIGTSEAETDGSATVDLSRPLNAEYLFVGCNGSIAWVIPSALAYGACDYGTGCCVAPVIESECDAMGGYWQEDMLRCRYAAPTRSVWSLAGLLTVLISVGLYAATMIGKRLRP